MMINFLCNLFSSNTLTTKEELDKMWRTGCKALVEHQKISSVYARVTQSLFLDRKESTPLKLTHTFADDIGPRPTMEDAHFFQEIEQGTIVGVFDGHGGKEVSKYASEQFRARFAEVLKAHKGNAYQAFHTLIDKIHKEVARKSQWNHMGSTAVISFIDKETHQIITATLGDSEANIYRSGESIPLSAVRDWTSKKDKQRLINAHGKHAENWFKRYGDNPKHIRSHLQYGVNVSRAIGDVDETGTWANPLVIHKPKITVNKLQKGDIVVLACDGLKDYVPEQEIADIVFSSWTIRNICRWMFTTFCCQTPKTLAQTLVNHAVYTRSAKDNVTVIAVEVS